MRPWLPLALTLLAPALASAQDAPPTERTALADAQACYAGDLGRCAIAGDAYHEGLGVPVSFPLAAQLYRYGCDRRDAASCRALGWVSQEGHGVPESAAAARRYYAIACDAGLGLACYDLGTLHWLGRGTPRSWDEGRALYERACELGHAEGCREVAYLHGRGMGVPRDLARTADLLRRACELGSATACAEARDPARAIARAERAEGEEDEDELGAEPAVHREPAISDEQLATLVGRFQRAPSASERRVLARRLVLGGVRLTCAQIAALMRTVAADSERIALGVALWPSAVDPGERAALEAALDHAGSRTLLREQTGH